MYRPGEFKITDQGINIAKLKEGALVLEVGCGLGETTERLEKNFGLKVSPIDTSLEMVRLTNTRDLQAKATYGDGEFLEAFPSKTFDGIISECVLSLIGKPDEAIHEAFCTLKKGGKYIISDLYYTKEDQEEVAEAARRANVDATTEVPYNQCNDDCEEAHEVRNVDFRYENIFFKKQLIKALSDTGFTDIYFEDFTSELESFVAEEIMKGEECSYSSDLKKKLEGKKGVGYFLIVATKA